MVLAEKNLTTRWLLLAGVLASMALCSYFVVSFMLLEFDITKWEFRWRGSLPLLWYAFGRMLYLNMIKLPEDV